MAVVWTTKPFVELSVNEYHDIIYLRTKIFVVEQQCPYQEVDKIDTQAIHIFGKNEDGEIVATARILPPGVSFPEMSLGRLAVNRLYRGDGIGQDLVKESLKSVEKLSGKQTIRIAAQEHLIDYYKHSGFKVDGEVYLEDNIPHIEMIIEKW